jgi:hypothetical protein
VGGGPSGLPAYHWSTANPSVSVGSLVRRFWKWPRPACVIPTIGQTITFATAANALLGAPADGLG